ncbi:hypothetical protein A6770_10700 [Nostoc minutum NIES-26]|uniref:Uncharacterized protein n=1 Tax=Nostoc minutum NIES-26 TaxID=1844469 RepID=A0A367RUD0_9NOSO|nr:hypothetical protein A6770_10700 [Nostoc minutum NIES-26]
MGIGEAGGDKGDKGKNNKGLPTKKISHRFGEQGRQCVARVKSVVATAVKQGEQGRKNLTIVFALTIE